MIRSRNIRYDDNPHFLDALSEINHPSKHILVQIFSGVQELATIENCLADIKSALPEAAIIGVTTAGEIVDGRSLNETMNVNITLFDHTEVLSALVDQNDDLTLAGRDLGKKIKKEDTKAVIAFGCGLKGNHMVNAQDMLTALQKEIPDVIIAGGQAGDNGASKITYVFTEAGITSCGFVAVSLNAKQLSVRNTYNLSWIPIGKKMTITRAEGPRVYSIDNMPPYEIYKHYLGEEVANGLPLSAADFPLIIDRDGMVQAIHATGVNEDGSFNFIHDFRSGEQMRFGYCHAGLLAMGANETYEVLSKEEVEAAFVYSCVSRKWVLGTDISVELSPIAKLSCSAGFYAYGEYFYHNTREALFLGQTMTVLALSETVSDKKAYKRDEILKINSETRQFRTLRVLHRLVETSATEIEAMNVELAALVHRDSLTGLHNRRRFDEKMKFEVKRHMNSGQPLSMVLFDVDFFKNYNDLYGHVAGDDCLRGIGQVVQNMALNPSDIRARYGGEEFAIILPATDEKRALEIAANIKDSIEALRIVHGRSAVNKYVTVSLGVVTAMIEKEMNPEELIEVCDKLLYDAKEEGRNRIVSDVLRF